MNTNNKSATLGGSISTAEVAKISPEGLLLTAGGRDYFLPHDQYPWFQAAPVEQVFNVELLHGHHLHWPELDVDLELASLESPDRYPLVAKN
ncbi:MAG: DUF2442 domain-containing protein [Verrucomicrobia bacterium]|nr:DUF2442 domain-containing protein [Verrucomicrobiota bacterium]